MQNPDQPRYDLSLAEVASTSKRKRYADPREAAEGSAKALSRTPGL